MRILNFTIIKLTFFLIAGILIGYFFEISVQASLSLSVSFLAILLAFFIIAKNHFITTIWFGLAAFSTLVSIGILTVTLHNEKKSQNHYTHQIIAENDSLKTITFRIREVLKPNNYYDKYLIDIFKVDGIKVTGKSLLNIQKDSIQLPLKVDDIFICKTAFKTISPPLNPHQFNYKKYLENKYIYHQLSLNSKPLFKVEDKKTTWFGIANNIRNHINTKLKTYPFKPDELAIINALLLGQRQDISEEIHSSYSNAGVIHILALSGLHIGIILWMLNHLFKPVALLKHGSFIKTLLLLIILWSFAMIAGLSASITRSVTMFSIVAIAMNLKRPTNIYNTLAISMLIILLFKPLFLFEVGFQLSYAAVFAIVSIVPYFDALWKPQNRLIKIYWKTFTVTMAAQLGILPISLYYFHQFPSLFFVSNLVIVPLLGMILGYGIGVIILAVLGILPNFAAIIYGYTIRTMNGFVDFISKKEAFLFQDIPFSFWYVLVSYIFIMALFRLLIKRNYQSVVFLLIAILMVQSAVIFTNYNQPSEEFIVFHKSGQSLLGNKVHNKMTIAQDFDGSTHPKNNIIRDYKIGNHTKTIEEDSIQSVYILNGEKLLVVDSLGVYNIKSFHSDYVLLRQSPKINLNRLIDSIKPKQIIADGSNYRSYIENWELICKKRKLPFHATGKMGAFIMAY